MKETQRICCYDGVCAATLTGPKHQRFCPFHAKLRKKEKTLECYTNAERAEKMAEWRARDPEKTREQGRLYQKLHRERQRLIRAGWPQKAKEVSHEKH